MSDIGTRNSGILHHPAHAKEPRFRITAASADRAPLFNRFLWKDYANRIMDVSSANAPHIVRCCTGEMLTDALLKSIELMLERHDVLNSSIEKSGGNLYLEANVDIPTTTMASQKVVINTSGQSGDR